MKTIGLVGGTGWISTAEYYRIINEEINRRKGGLEFARCILYSLNYGDIARFNHTGDKAGIYKLIRKASTALVKCGADCIVLCANTVHQFADALVSEIDIPIIHIADATTRELKRKNIRKTGLLGTIQTMEMDFYKSRLYGEKIETLIPGKKARNFIQKAIDEELLKGILKEKTHKEFLSICNDLKSGGAEAIILGCTEIPLIVKQEDLDIPVFNTLLIHSLAAVDFALS